MTDEQKVRFAAQQLLGSASAWWDTFYAMQPMDHHVTWREFTTAFYQYYIHASVLNRKLPEFLEWKQGNINVMEYTRTHVDTDEKKMDCFNHGLSCILQEKLYIGSY